FLPVPEDFTKLFGEGFEQLSKPALFFLVAFSTAVCEELVFRGAFLGLLRRTGTTRAAVLASSAVFAVIHLSVFRLVPTFLLGLAMAVLVVRTGSLFPAVLYHMTYNGIAVLGGERLEAMSGGAAAWLASGALLAAGYFLVARSRTSTTTS
ncbi:MAG: CPBP family glutamic-type intramembrane protease, partial [bacterium]